MLNPEKAINSIEKKQLTIDIIVFYVAFCME